MAEDVWLRNMRRTRLFAAYTVVWSLGFAAIFFVPNHHWHKTTGDQLVLGVFFFGTAAAGLVLARRVARAGLWLGGNGIVIRNPLKRWTVPLGDARAFVVGNDKPSPYLVRQHGGAVVVWALGREGVVWRFARYQRELQPLCDELNAVLRELQRR